VSYLDEEIPKALTQALEGVTRVATIVRAMKDFAHTGGSNKTPVDLNRALESTLTVARNELKYVADVETDFGSLPLVECHAGEVNQVFLNLLVNAAHAIGDVVHESEARGTIRIRTRCEGDAVVIEIADTGTGIPEAVRAKIFDPFFTTKEVGRGTGQGLAIARSIVVEKHGGALTFETEAGRGTTFFIRLPIGGGTGDAADAASLPA
jgi:signal transduction histidine kinase